MADLKPTEPMAVRRRDEPIEIGGLRFIISENDYGANLAVFADLPGGWAEVIRFQDYVDDPHYHAPVGGWFAFDREKLGEPLAWWMRQITEDLPAWLERTGFSGLLPSIDIETLVRRAGEVTDAMIACLPPAYARIPGYGVHRVDWSEDESAFQKRNEYEIEFGGLLFEVFFDRDLGATMEVFAVGDDRRVEMLRLDDYDENPHYHAPVGVWHNYDRVANGEPLAWFIAQLRDNLAELLTSSGYASLLSEIDLGAISAGADRLYDAMAARVPRGCARVPGVGLVRTEPAA